MDRIVECKIAEHDRRDDAGYRKDVSPQPLAGYRKSMSLPPFVGSLKYRLHDTTTTSDGAL